MNQEQDKTEIKFIYSILGIFLFFVVAVLPAMNQEEKIMHIIGQINTQGIDSIKNNNVDVLIEKDFKETIALFKIPSYVFLFMKEETEKEYQKILPREIKIKII